MINMHDGTIWGLRENDLLQVKWRRDGYEFLITPPKCRANVEATFTKG